MSELPPVILGLAVAGVMLAVVGFAWALLEGGAGPPDPSELID